MKFKAGDKVEIIGSGKTGEIHQTKHEIQILNGKKKEVKRYEVWLGGVKYLWLDEDQLKDTLELKNEKKVLELLIDVNLSVKNFDMVKILSEQLNKLSK